MGIQQGTAKIEQVHGGDLNIGQRQKVNSKNSLVQREERKLFQEIKGKPKRG